MHVCVCFSTIKEKEVKNLKESKGGTGEGVWRGGMKGGNHVVILPKIKLFFKNICFIN